MRAALLVVCLVPALGFQDEAVFRAAVDDVRVDAQVVEGRRVIATLEKEDFLVLDEGEPQKIAYFGRDAEPVRVLLLLDVSGSMGLRLAEMAETARDILGALGPADEVAVMFFGRTTLLAQPFTKSMGEAAAVIGTSTRFQPVGSGTVINGAILDAARYVGREAGPKAGRRAIVILTDNKGLQYAVPNDKVMEVLSDADTVLNAVVTPDAVPPAPPRPGLKLNPDFTPADVFALSESSGGEVLRMEKASVTFREMLERIRTRYSLHYRAPEAPPGQVRHLRVELAEEAKKRHPGAVVRARRSYRIPD